VEEGLYDIAKRLADKKISLIWPIFNPLELFPGISPWHFLLELPLENECKFGL
jgi:hypothetical protein